MSADLTARRQSGGGASRPDCSRRFRHRVRHRQFRYSRRDKIQPSFFYGTAEPGPTVEVFLTDLATATAISPGTIVVARDGTWTQDRMEATLARSRRRRGTPPPAYKTEGAYDYLVDEKTITIELVTFTTDGPCRPRIARHVSAPARP